MEKQKNITLLVKPEHCNYGFCMMDASKLTLKQLVEFINENIRVESPKTGKEIKFNTYRIRREDALKVVNTYLDMCYGYIAG